MGSQRGIAFLRRAARRILSDNRQQVARKRLRGALQSRLLACEIAGDILALTRLNASTSTEPTPSKLRNQVVAELRSTSLDLRTASEGRIAAIQRLAILEGLLPITELGTNPQDEVIKSLLAANTPQPQKPTVVPVIDYAALMKAAEDKYLREGGA